MVTNPNSNLVFDFPDPTPHFEFGDPVGAGSSGAQKVLSPGKTKRGKRFGKGKFGGKGRAQAQVQGQGGGGNDHSPSKHSTGTATTASLNDSMGSGLGDADLSLNHSGDIAAGPASRSPSPLKLKLVPATGTGSGIGAKRAPSSGHSASGYISEVSEFSFDRVSVTTNETNPSSNIDWGFLDEPKIAALGGGQDRQGAKHSRRAPSASSLSNVSLSSEEDCLPVTGVVDESAQSVVSEMSERTRSNLDFSDTARVRAILRDGMESARRKDGTRGTGVAELSSVGAGRGGDLVAVRKATQESDIGAKTMGGGRTVATATSSIDDTAAAARRPLRKKSLFSDIRASYHDFVVSRRDGPRERKSVLRGIVEDAQFCGLYFCGVDTTGDEAVGEGGGGLTTQKEERRRRQQADETFLGRVIRCGDGMCGAM